MAKDLTKMTVEELRTYKTDQAKKKKEAAEAEAAADLRLATKAIVDVVKNLRVPELFTKIRKEAGNDELDSVAILNAIAEAAGVTGFELVKKAANKAKGKSAPKSAASIKLAKLATEAKAAEKAANEAEVAKAANAAELRKIATAKRAEHTAQKAENAKTQPRGKKKAA